ncbi:MAG: hypothetical protein OHK0021_01760 [Bryobacter sp.]|nr:hypothetical protein [Bryobacter sp.]
MPQSHQTIDQRSRALHLAVARELEAHPEKWEIVWQNLARDEQSGQAHASYAQRWRQLLELPWEELKAKLGEATEEMDALRQCSPFSGVLPNEERWRIFEEYR